MKQPRVTRRQFFKLSAFSAVAAAGLPAIGIAAVAAAPTKEAMAAAEAPQGPAIPQPTFNPIASNTTFGPLTDISMGWDGTLWGIDGQGAPHVYDEINKVWAQHGDGIDAAVLAGSTGTTLYVFSGPQVVTIDTGTLQVTALTTIAALWPSLPDTFKLGVAGACTATFNGGLILFNGGRYVSTDGSVPAGKLTDLANWPQTANWKDGVIDGVMTNASGLGFATLIRAGEAVDVDLQGKKVPHAPWPFNPGDYMPVNPSTLPASWAGGIDAGARIFTAGGNMIVDLLFKGTVVAVVTSATAGPTTQIKYVGNLVSNWPATWHPVLAHAPNGRDGNLWCATTKAQNNIVVQHNGDAWKEHFFQADHVGVGQDNSVMLATGGYLFAYDPNRGGSGFYSVTPPSNLVQVSLGNSNAVHARDSAGNVYRFDFNADRSAGTLTQNADASANGGATHIATTSDGSLWHAKPNNPQMHRQLLGSGTTPDAISVKNGLTATVNKVAGTGFGLAHCLTTDTQGNTQAYRYDSPYVFKTARQYDVYNTSLAPANIEQGAGLLYVVDNVVVGKDPLGGFFTKPQIVAIDAHTGAEMARTPMLPDPLLYGVPVFDPFNNLVYVGVIQNSSIDTDGNAGPGQLLALDGKTLAVKWSFTTAASVDAKPSLSGSRLCVGDRTGALYMFDTTTAVANPTNVQPRWKVNAVSNAAQTHRIAPPVFVPVNDPGLKGDLIYVAVWDINGSNQGYTATATWRSYWVVDGTQNDAPQALHSINSAQLQLSPGQLLVTPVNSVINIGDDAKPNYTKAIYYNCWDAVVAVGGGPTTKSFSLPAGSYISTGFTFDDGRTTAPPLTSTTLPVSTGSLWFGTNNGSLYCLNTDLQPVNYTPASINDAAQPKPWILTTPALYKDISGSVTVYFNAYDPGVATVQPSLLGFDPTSGIIAAVPTGATRVVALSKSVTNGVIYAAGFIDDNQPDGSFPQIFAIRVDQLAQAERDFIIESQLMQDPQDPGNGGSKVTAPDGNIIPSSVSRYQTHLTVVDDKKHPLPNEPVKIWADVAGAVITVEGTQYTIGPADTAFASVKTGNDGCVVITTDAKDVNASALRVWAAFMDPFERIMIYPDHEWHGRVTQSNVTDTVSDPGKPNLNKAYKYDGTTLFTDSERQQGTTTNVANAVGQMNSGLNPGASKPAAFAGALKTLHGSNPIAPYVAYTTLGGMHYGPNNARAKRTATVAAPFGFVLNKPASGTHTYTPLTHSDARSQIDALEGKPWDPNNPNGTAATGEVKPMTFVIRRSDDLFTDFWNWLKGVVSQIENVIVSVADDIMVGINFIANGIKQAFKAIIKVIEDVVNAIGSFFLQLLKAIEDLIAALSILFHFGEIMWTHRWLASLLGYQKEQLKTIIASNKTTVDNWFTNSEETIGGWIDKVKAQISGQQSFNTMPGAGATPHSAMTAGSGQAGNTNSGSSQAVQGGWGVQKMKSGFGSPAAAPGLANAAVATKTTAPQNETGDPVSDFVNGFINSLSSNAQLSQALSDAKNDISNTFTANSPSAFFTGLLTTLLDILKILLDSALAISQAIFDGVFNALDDIIDAIWNALNDSIEIPVISWLYKLLFQEDLTLLNLATLVVAIPVTVIYRVVTGEYPQDSHNASPYSPWSTSASTALVNSPQRALDGIAPDWAQKTIGTASGIFNLAYGIINGLNDFNYPLIRHGIAQSPIYAKLGNLAVGLGLVNAALGYPGFSTDLNKISLGTWFTYVVSCGLACYGVVGLSTFDFDDATSAALGVSNAVCYAILLIGFISDFAVNGSRDVNSDLNFSSSLIGCLPSIINPIKFPQPEIAGFVNMGVDFFAGAATCALGIAATWHSEPSAIRRQRRLFFPFIANGLPNPRAIPLAAGATP